MTRGAIHLRRATIEDLPRLQALWRTALLPDHALKRELTEFQLVEGGDGRLIGAVGIQLLGQDARIYNEVWSHPESEQVAKAQLWNWLVKLIQSHGIHRVWTQEKSGYWQECGFVEPTESQVQMLPKAWRQFRGSWRFFTFYDERAEEIIAREIDYCQTVHEDDLKQTKQWSQSLKWALSLLVVAIVFYYLILLILSLKIS